MRMGDLPEVLTNKNLIFFCKNQCSKFDIEADDIDIMHVFGDNKERLSFK